MKISRRSLLVGAGGLASAALIGGCGNGEGESSESGGALDIMWWGADSRAELTEQVFDIYTEQSGVSVTGQFLSFGNYFDKLATLAAAGSLPDIVQANPYSLSQYSGNGQFLDLSTLDLDLGDYQDSAKESGYLQGTPYGLAFGYQYVTTFYNVDLLTSTGMELPGVTATWDDWIAYAVELQAELPEGVYALTDVSDDGNAFESWMVGRGKALFTDDGALAFDRTDTVDWLKYWTGLRSQGAVPPGAESVTHLQTGAVTDSPLTKGSTVMSLGINVGFEGYQMVNQDTLGITACPVGPVQRCETNHFFGWSVNAETSRIDEVKEFLELWFTSPEVAKILGTDRALPASETALNAVNEGAEGATKLLLEFSIATPEIVPLNPPPAPASVGNTMSDALNRMAVAVASGSATEEEAAEAYHAEVEATLNG